MTEKSLDLIVVQGFSISIYKKKKVLRHERYLMGNLLAQEKKPFQFNQPTRPAKKIH